MEHVLKRFDIQLLADPINGGDRNNLSIKQRFPYLDSIMADGDLTM